MIPVAMPLARGMIAMLLLLSCLGGCTLQSLRAGSVSSGSAQQAATDKLDTTSDRLGVMLEQMEPHTELQDSVKKGIVALRDGRYELANTQFQHALRLDPANGHLHYLNALAYHMGFLAGNSKMLNLARAGYVTALKFDEANHMAAYLLGQTYFHQKQYKEAQNQFSYGLLYAPQDPALLRALATASYYAHDLETSGWASERAYSLEPDNTANIRNYMFAKAAVGDFDKADALMGQYRTVALQGDSGGNAYWRDRHVEDTSSRLQDWKNYYALNIFSTPPPDIVTYSADPADGEGQPGQEQQEGGQNAGTVQAPAGAMPSASPVHRDSGNYPKMANVDVVILRTEELRSQSKGINLLDSLKTTLTGTLAEYNYTSGDNGQRSFTINPRLELMGLEYNLNIFNDGFNKAEILARPSLLATEGSTSNFFSGGELHVQLSSSNYDGSMVDIPIGITLNVTPTFRDQDTVEIVVHAEHSYLQMQSAEVGFTAFSQTTKTSVDATATLKFGETLILSGLSERGNDRTKSGVPLLQEIPGVQYLFSHDEQLQTKTSILILLTPRKATYAKDTLTDEEFESGADLEKVFVAEMKKKVGIANTNLNSAIAHLAHESDFYRQFRTGDMALNFWEDDDSLYGALSRIMGFLYY